MLTAHMTYHEHVSKCLRHPRLAFDWLYGKGKEKSLYLTLVVPSVTKLVSMEADGALITLVSAPFYGYLKL